MASIPELRICCKELNIDDKDLTIDQMKQSIRNEFDKLYTQKSCLGNSEFSTTLLKFITTEYDFVLKNKKGQDLDCNLKLRNEK